MCSDTFDGFTETSSKPDTQIINRSQVMLNQHYPDRSDQCAPILLNELIKTSSKADTQIKQVSDNVEPTLEPSEQCAPILSIDLLKHQASHIFRLNRSQIMLNHIITDRPEQCAPILLMD